MQCLRTDAKTALSLSSVLFTSLLKGRVQCLTGIGRIYGFQNKCFKIMLTVNEFCML